MGSRKIREERIGRIAMTVNIAKDFSKTPGGRLKIEGENSGEEFREKVLKHAYQESKNKGETLIINLDGGYGYAVSFLEEAFGGLAREIKDQNLLGIVIISDEEPALINRIKTYINDGLE